MVGHPKQSHGKWRQFGGARFAAHDLVSSLARPYRVHEQANAIMLKP